MISLLFCAAIWCWPPTAHIYLFRFAGKELVQDETGIEVRIQTASKGDFRDQAGGPEDSGESAQTRWLRRSGKDIPPQIRKPSRGGGSRLPRRESARFAADADPLLIVQALLPLLGAGMAPKAALQLVLANSFLPSGPQKAAWEQVLVALRDGENILGAWQHLAQQTGTPELVDLGRTWVLALQAGAPLRASLERMTAAIHRRREHNQTVKVAAGSGKATAGVLAFLPALGSGLAWILGVPPWQAYAGSRAWVTFWPGIGLLTIGLYIIWRLVHWASTEPALRGSSA